MSKVRRQRNLSLEELFPPTLSCPLVNRFVHHDVETLQKLSLAATAVAVALWSNALLLPEPFFRKAKEELEQLMRIKEGVDQVSMRDLVNKEIEEKFKTESKTIAPMAAIWQIHQSKQLMFVIESPKKADLKYCGLEFNVPRFFYLSDQGLCWPPSSDGFDRYAFPDLNLGGSVPDQQKVGSLDTLEGLQILWDKLVVPRQLFEMSGELHLVSLRADDGEIEDEKSGVAISQMSPYANNTSIKEAVRLRAVTPFERTSASEKKAFLQRDYRLEGPVMGGINILSLSEQQNYLQHFQITLQFVGESRGDIVPLHSLLNYGLNADQKLNSTFSDAFPNLGQLLKGNSSYERKRLADLKDDLAEKISSENYDFELFGIKVRGDQINEAPSAEESRSS